MYANRNILFTGGSITHVAGHLYHNEAPKSPSGFQLLCEHAAANALHNSGEVSEQPKCHPGTRVAILNELKSWAAALVYEYPVEWLHGPAGAGKSAIQRTIAQILQDEGLFLASFFFFRSDPNRNSSARFIATIAYQLALAIPKTREHIEHAIEKDPFVFSSSIRKQVQRLIINPILLVQEESPLDIGSYPRVIIVDGLDECNDPDKQCDILEALSRAIEELPIPVAVLVASRPEHHIRGAFDLGDLNRLSSRIGLDESYNPDVDIKKYLRERFDVIHEQHVMKSSLPGSQWPSPEIIDTLVTKASGQFIYASTVEKFINSPRHNPARRLDVILGARDAGNLKPFKQLDILYSTIFSAVVEELDITLLILGALLVPYTEPEQYTNEQKIRSPAHFERLFQLETGDVRRLFYDLESLLDIRRNDQNIRFFHASLSDYLFDRSRSGQFWINTEFTYAALAEHYIHCLPEWPHIHNVFMNNVDLFFSKATVTPGLQSAIQKCDLKRLISLKNPYSSALKPYPFGLNYVAPTLLDAAIEKSRFVNADEVFAVQFSAYQQLIEAVIQVYFDNFRLKAFLVIISMPVIWNARKRSQIFPLSPKEIGIERQLGFNFSDSVEAPPLLRYITGVLDDPKKWCFVDEDQYADIILYGLDNLHKYSRTSNDHLIFSASQIFSHLLPKSSIRNDLTKSIKRILQDCPLMISQAFLEAIETYLARAGLNPHVLSLNESETFRDGEGDGSQSSPLQPDVDAGLDHSDLDVIPAVTIIGPYRREEDSTVIFRSKEESPAKPENNSHRKEEEESDGGCCKCVTM